MKDLVDGAHLYWPKALIEEAAKKSSLLPLIETQDIFLSVLKTADVSPDSWEKVIEQSSQLSPNLFVKHLMVLSDIGGERLQRFAKDFSKLFPNKSFEYAWKGKTHSYKFNNSKKRSWTNKELYVEKSVLLDRRKHFTPEMKDVSMLLMWGSSITNCTNLPQELIDKCLIGTLLGCSDELDTYVKQRYIAVSRITGGSTANDLGHICEEYVIAHLNKELPKHITLGGHTIAGISHNEKNLTTFDLVAKNNTTKKCVAIEISFQVTTNSTIERKAGLAKSRRDIVRRSGHKIAYVIDGSGNFQRRNAIQSIIDFSDCAVNFSNDGLTKLAKFIRESTTS